MQDEQSPADVEVFDRDRDAARLVEIEALLATVEAELAELDADEPSA